MDEPLQPPEAVISANTFLKLRLDYFLAMGTAGDNSFVGAGGVYIANLQRQVEQAADALIAVDAALGVQDGGELRRFREHPRERQHESWFRAIERANLIAARGWLSLCEASPLVPMLASHPLMQELSLLKAQWSPNESDSTKSLRQQLRLNLRAHFGLLIELCQSMQWDYAAATRLMDSWRNATVSTSQEIGDCIQWLLKIRLQILKPETAELVAIWDKQRPKQAKATSVARLKAVSENLRPIDLTNPDDVSDRRTRLLGIIDQCRHLADYPKQAEESQAALKLIADARNVGNAALIERIARDARKLEGVCEDYFSKLSALCNSSLGLLGDDLTRLDILAHGPERFHLRSDGDWVPWYQNDLKFIAGKARKWLEELPVPAPIGGSAAPSHLQADEDRTLFRKLCHDIRSVNSKMLKERYDPPYDPQTAYLFDPSAGITRTGCIRDVGEILCRAYREGALHLTVFESFRVPEIDQAAVDGDIQKMVRRLAAWLEIRGHRVMGTDKQKNPFDRLADALEDVAASLISFPYHDQPIDSESADVARARMLMSRLSKCDKRSWRRTWSADEWADIFHDLNSHIPMMDVLGIDVVVARQLCEFAFDRPMGDSALIDTSDEQWRAAMRSVAEFIHQKSRPTVDASFPTLKIIEQSERGHPDAHHSRPAEGTESPASDISQFEWRFTGNVWQIRFGSETGTFSDVKGFEIIHKMLGDPNPVSPMLATELHGSGSLDSETDQSYQETIDPTAKNEYRIAIGQYDKQIEQANSNGDQPKAAQLERERAEVIDHLTKSLGLGGKARNLGPADASKSAEVATRQNVNRARGKLTESMPKLAEHLVASIKIAKECAYRPTQFIPWKLE